MQSRRRISILRSPASLTTSWQLFRQFAAEFAAPPLSSRFLAYLYQLCNVWQSLFGVLESYGQNVFLGEVFRQGENWHTTLSSECGGREIHAEEARHLSLGFLAHARFWIQP